MNRQLKIAFSAAVVLWALVSLTNFAIAAKCQSEPISHMDKAPNRTISVKVTKGAVCQYTFRSSSTAMRGVRILKKPPSARVITNSYGIAYSFSHVGTYNLNWQIQTDKGPWTINMNVEVVPDKF